MSWWWAAISFIVGVFVGYVTPILLEMREWERIRLERNAYLLQRAAEERAARAAASPRSKGGAE